MFSFVQWPVFFHNRKVFGEMTSLISCETRTCAVSHDSINTCSCHQVVCSTVSPFSSSLSKLYLSGRSPWFCRERKISFPMLLRRESSGRRARSWQNLLPASCEWVAVKMSSALEMRSWRLRIRVASRRLGTSANPESLNF